MLHIPTSRNGEIRITTYSTPYGNTYGTPYDNTYGTSYGNTYGTPYGNTYDTPYGNTYGTAIAHLPQLHYTSSSSAKKL